MYAYTFGLKTAENKVSTVRYLYSIIYANETFNQISGVLPVHDEEIMIGSAKAYFLEDTNRQINTRIGGDNALYRMSDTVVWSPEP